MNERPEPITQDELQKWMRRILGDNEWVLSLTTPEDSGTINVGIDEDEKWISISNNALANEWQAKDAINVLLDDENLLP